MPPSKCRTRQALLSNSVAPREPTDDTTSAALDAETADETLSSGHDGSSGRNAAPHLSTARTAATYSTDGEAYTPTILGTTAPAARNPSVRSEFVPVSQTRDYNYNRGVD